MEGDSEKLTAMMHMYDGPLEGWTIPIKAFHMGLRVSMVEEADDPGLGPVVMHEVLDLRKDSPEREHLEEYTLTNQLDQVGNLIAKYRWSANDEQNKHHTGCD